jgi:hypothetical protein
MGKEPLEPIDVEFCNFKYFIFFFIQANWQAFYLHYFNFYNSVNFYFSVLELNKVQFSTKEDSDDVVMDSLEEGMKYAEL